MRPNRRQLLKACLAAPALGWLPAYGTPGATRRAPHVAVVGGGFGGATLARYLRLWSEGTVAVTLIERNPAFVSCPVSNLVIHGSRTLADLTLGYRNLQDRWGVRIIHDEVTAIDAERQNLRLAGGGTVTYDRLALSPGVDFDWAQIPALATAKAQAAIPHAWKAGPQTLALRRQLEAMRDGGVFVLCIPKAPYRCPPGPYERASLVAHYLQKNKPRSKVLVLDANDDILSKKALFLNAWQTLYKGLIEYRPGSVLRDVDVAGRKAILEFDTVAADVLNVIPPQRAGDVARRAGLRLINERWVDIDWLSMEAGGATNIHVIGDAIFPAPGMPKSGHMANQQAKLAAAAILDRLAGRPPAASPVINNTCYSFVSPEHAIHVASVHRYDAATRTLQPVTGAGGVSLVHNEYEARVAHGWARTIWADMLA